MRFFRVWGFAMLAAGAMGIAGRTFAESAEATRALDARSSTALLRDALNGLLEHQGRWAYTETRTGVGRDGKALAESSARFDPSVVYAEQYKPILVRGKAPTEKQLKEAADRGEREGKRRFDEREKLAAMAAFPTNDPERNEKPEEIHLWVAGKKATPLIDQAKVVAEDATSVTYEVPMIPEKGAAKLLEKFELTARVNKATRDFERATIRQREAVRVKVIAKIADANLTIDFSTPDPRYPSVPTRFTSHGSVALFFGKAKSGRVQMERTDLRHVTPYDDRFDVKLGPVRTIEF
jgi:hypothetical protein